MKFTAHLCGILLTISPHITLTPSAEYRLLYARATCAAQDEEVIRVRTDLVSVPVFVTDARGRRVSGLTREDFSVTDEGVRVETAYFASGAERVALLFLLDASGSTRDTISRQRDAALGLFERFGDRSRVAVMHFDERASSTIDFTRDAVEARKAFTFVARPDGRTAVFDSALSALRTFHAGDPAERRIIVLISDGLDTVSRTRPFEVIREANLRNVSIYVVHLPLYWAPEGRLVARRPAKGFREIAEKTGGRFLVVGDERSALDPGTGYDLRPVLSAISEDLSGQYVLGFYAPGEVEPSRPRRIEVRLKSAAKSRLRLRQLRESYTPQAGAQ